MKFKSYGFWTSLAAGAVVLFGVLNKTFGFEINEKIISDIVLGFAGVLVVLGIVKNPNSRQSLDNEDNIEQATKQDIANTDCQEEGIKDNKNNKEG